MENVLCPICQIDDNEPFLVSNNMTVVRCRHCGLLYVNPRLKAEAISRHYREDYISDEKRVEIDFISYRKASLAREAEKIRFLKPEGGQLLDVGAASGEFLRHFADEPKWQVEGVEPSSYAAEYAKEKFGMKVFNGFLIDAQYENNEFDVITSLDTFYFHPDPCRDLSEMARIIKPGGFLAIEIPGLNFRLLKNTGLICRILYREPARLNAMLHLYFYSKHTLTRLVAKYGFSPVAAYAVQSPVYGPPPLRLLNSAYFISSKLIALLSMNKINLVPKEFLIFQREVL